MTGYARLHTVWHNKPATDTPVNAVAMQHIEDALFAKTSHMARAFTHGGLRGRPSVWVPPAGDGATVTDVPFASISAGDTYYAISTDGTAPFRSPNGVYTGDDGSGINWNAPLHLGADIEIDVEGQGCGVFLNNSDANACYQWIIDGKALTARPVKYGGTGARLVYIDFTDHSSSARRNVIFRSGGAFPAYVGARQGASVFKPMKRRHFAIIGDSLCSGASSDQCTFGNAVPDAMGVLTGEPFRNYSVGGTGYCADNSSSGKGGYGSTIRLNGMVAAEATTEQDGLDGIVVWGGANDISWMVADPTNHTATMVGTAAAQLYADLNTRFPGVPVAVMGLEPSPVLTQANSTVIGYAADVQARLAAAAAAAPNVVSFVDALTHPWIDSSVAGNDVMADGVHWYPETTFRVAQKYLAESFA